MSRKFNVEYYKSHPAEFISDYYGIELLPCQKTMLDKMCDEPDMQFGVISPRCRRMHLLVSEVVTELGYEIDLDK